MLVLDILSRSHLNHSKPGFTENSLIHHVHFVPSNLPINETRLKKFQLETKNDPILETLILNHLQNHEWSGKHLISTSDSHPYYIHHSDITFCEGLVLKNERIIVPTTVQVEMKPLLHQGYLGIAKKSAI